MRGCVGVVFNSDHTLFPNHHHMELNYMDSFDNFQYDSASSYGGLPIVDDTSSVVSGYTTTTQNRLPTDLESLSGLSLSGDTPYAGGNRSGNADLPVAMRAGAIEEDLLEDFKDESAVELPPHACRQVHAHVSNSTHIDRDICCI
jgi:regulator of nonsense transcripts 1